MKSGASGLQSYRCAVDREERLHDARRVRDGYATPFSLDLWTFSVRVPSERMRSAVTGDIAPFPVALGLAQIPSGCLAVV